MNTETFTNRVNHAEGDEKALLNLSMLLIRDYCYVQVGEAKKVCLLLLDVVCKILDIEND